MQKLMTVFSALVLSTAIGASGCKNKNANNDQPTPSAKTTDQPITPTTTTPTTPTPGTASGSDLGSASGSAYGSASGVGSNGAPATGTSAIPPTPSGATTQTATNDTGVPECDEYARTFDRYLACDKVPQQAKDASKANIEQMRQSWSGLKDPNVAPAAKASAADACKQATAALQSSAKALGCTL